MQRTHKPSSDGDGLKRCCYAKIESHSRITIHCRTRLKRYTLSIPRKTHHTLGMVGHFLFRQYFIFERLFKVRYYSQLASYAENKHHYDLQAYSVSG